MLENGYLEKIAAVTKIKLFSLHITKEKILYLQGKKSSLSFFSYLLQPQ